MQRAVRAVALLICFAIGVGTVVGGGISWLADARLGRPTLVFDYARMMDKRLPGLANARAAGRRGVAFLGDSGVVSYPEGETVPDRLQQRIDRDIGRRRGEIQITSLGMSGSGPFDYYSLADRIAGARPEAVVISLNLDHFSLSWSGAYSRPQLTGLIDPARVPEALALPFHWIGLTADRLLFYVAVVQSGGYDPWYWLTLRQNQVGRARERFETWLQGGAPRGEDDTPERLFKSAADAATIARLFTGPDIRHYRTPGLLDHYRETLDGIEPDHPVLEVLGATVRRLRDADAKVLVYVAPVEVAWLEREGVLGPDGFAESLARMREVVNENGGEFADLHDALPADSFRDAPGHLTHRPDGPDGPARLVDHLQPLVMRVLAGWPLDVEARAEARAEAEAETGAP